MRAVPVALAFAVFAVAGCDGGGVTGGDGSRPDSGGMSTMCASGPLAAPRTPCTLSPLPSTGDPAEDCVRRINQFRYECQCLPPLMRWTDGEACAAENAQYDFENGRTPHAGFRAGICESGFGQNECPGWPDEASTIGSCLQQMWDEGPGEPFSEHGHYINMSSTRFDRVACGWFTTPSGDVWAVQNFR